MLHFCPIGSAPDGQKLPALVAHHPPDWLMSDVGHRTSFLAGSDGLRCVPRCCLFATSRDRQIANRDTARRVTSPIGHLMNLQ